MVLKSGRGGFPGGGEHWSKLACMSVPRKWLFRQRDLVWARLGGQPLQQDRGGIICGRTVRVSQGTLVLLLTDPFWQGLGRASLALFFRWMG